MFFNNCLAVVKFLPLESCLILDVCVSCVNTWGCLLLCSHMGLYRIISVEMQTHGIARNVLHLQMFFLSSFISQFFFSVFMHCALVSVWGKKIHLFNLPVIVPFALCQKNINTLCYIQINTVLSHSKFCVKYINNVQIVSIGQDSKHGIYFKTKVFWN